MPGTKTTEEKISAFTWLGETVRVNDGKDVIKILLDRLAQKSAVDLQMLAMCMGRRKSWIKQDPAGFDRPYRIKGTNWFVDTNMSTANIKKKARQIVTYFGHEPTSIKFESRHTPK